MARTFSTLAIDESDTKLGGKVGPHKCSKNTGVIAANAATT
jgi:hypothetical protein